MQMKNMIIVFPVVLFLLSNPSLSWAAEGDLIKLPPPRLESGMPLMQALKGRQTTRAFSTKPLPEQILGDLLWAAYGINRPESGKRTAPSAHNRQEIDLYVTTAQGLYLYNAKAHGLQLILAKDIRALTGKQQFPGQAPLNLVYVLNFSRMEGVGRQSAIETAAVATGAIVQNVYLYCASEGLVAVARGWVDRAALATAMGLTDDHYIVLAQTVGFPK